MTGTRGYGTPGYGGNGYGYGRGSGGYSFNSDSADGKVGATLDAVASYSGQSVAQVAHDGGYALLVSGNASTAYGQTVATDDYIGGLAQAQLSAYADTSVDNSSNLASMQEVVQTAIGDGMQVYVPNDQGNLVDVADASSLTPDQLAAAELSLATLPTLASSAIPYNPAVAAWVGAVGTFATGSPFGGAAAVTTYWLATQDYSNLPGGVEVWQGD